MAAARMESPDPIKNLTSILDLFNGKTGSEATSGSTITTRTDFTADQVNDQIKAILGSTQGLASVAMGEKMSGMYNSTVKQQSMNDLLARISSQVMEKKVGTTVTKSGETKTAQTEAPLSQGKGLQALLGLGGSALLKPTLGRAKNKLGIGDPGEALADFLFGSSAGTIGGESIMGSTAGGAAEAFAAAYPATPAAVGGELGSGLFGMAELEGLLGGTSAAGLGGVEAAGAGAGAGANFLTTVPGIGALIGAALYADQNTKDSRLQDVGQNIIDDPLKALGDTLGGFVGNFGGLFK